MKKIISLLATAFVFWGCSDELPEKNPDASYDPSKVITIAPLMTKGAMINSEAQMSTLGVYCSYTAQTDWTTASTPSKMFNRQLNRNASGQWVYANNTPENWNATTPNDRYTFFSYAPYGTGNYDATNNLNGNGIVVNGSGSTAGVPRLTYTVPSNCANQPDLMVSVIQRNIRKTPAPVSLSMQHALTSVGFKLIGAGQQVSKITVKGVKSTGTLAIQGDSIVWTNVSGSSDVDVKLTTGITLGPVGQQMNSVDGYLMMIPQILTANAQVVVTLQNGSTRQASLNTQTWSAGKHVDYVMTITPTGLITVSPTTIVIPASGEIWGAELINIVCEDVLQSWTFTCPDSWLQLSTSVTGSAAAQTVAGQGTAIVYARASANTGTTDRTTTITASSGAVITVKQLKKIDPSTYTRGGTPPVGTTPYIGAFWKSTQTGERIIRVSMGTSAANAGTWTASVAWMDSGWTNGDIVLSTDLTADANVDFTTIKTPGDAESYPVNSLRSIVTGTVAANGIAYFRVGLKSTFAPSALKPARYAVILLQYGTPVQEQLIYLRQGHDPDYLMRTNESGTPGSSLASRPSAVRFSPYNLTATTVLDGGPLLAQQTLINLLTNPGTFTQFPTQAGLMFQWASVTNPLFAYSPVNPLTGITGWSNIIPAVPWIDPIITPTLSSLQEACPQSYGLSYGGTATFRRPNNGSTSVISAPVATSISEVSQSLWLDPAGSGSNTSTNFMIGYYADGYFDRRMLESTTAATQGASNCAVAWNTKDVAYAGTLFYNPVTCASLFFPSAGVRDANTATNGVVSYPGSVGLYWTSTSVNANQSTSLVLGVNSTTPTGFAVQTAGNKVNGQSIRCVR